jgi:hypothetical protein
MMKIGHLIATSVATGALWFALPAHAQILGGGAAGEAAGTLGQDGLGVGAAGDVTGRLDAREPIDSTGSRIRGSADTAAEAAAEAQARTRASIEDARNRAESTRVRGSLNTQGSASADVDDDPSVSASGGASASAGVTTDD